MESFALFTGSALGTLVAVLLIITIWQANKLLWSVKDIPFALRVGSMACFSGLVILIMYVYFAHVLMETGGFELLATP